MGFSNRILDVTFILHHLTEVDLDVVLTIEEPPTVILDTVITAAYGVTDEGNIDEFTAIRVTKPAEVGDKIVYLPPSSDDYDRHSKEIILGKTGEENSTDIYRGDISVMPGKAVGGIGKTLLLKSQSGLASYEIPDTPIITSEPVVYDANELFELEGIAPGAYQELKWDKQKELWYSDQTSLITFKPLRFNDWILEDKGTFELFFDPLVCHINDIKVSSKDVRLNKTLIKGYLPFPYESGKITVELSWQYASAIEKELKTRNMKIDLVMDVWDLRLGSILKYTEKREIGFGEGYFDIIKFIPSNKLYPKFGGGIIVGPAGRALAGTGSDESISYFESARFHEMSVCDSAIRDLGTIKRQGNTDENLFPIPYRIFSIIGNGVNVDIKTQAENRDSDIGLPVYLNMNNLTNESTILVSW